MSTTHGGTFGRWTVLESRGERWLCQCSCGAVKSVVGRTVRSGASRSCGCLKRDNVIAKNTTHGSSNTRLFGVWCAMRKRCENNRDRSWKNYGGRGISVCEEWHDFAVFQKWALSNGYERGLTIERNDNCGSYDPSNCCFATHAIQSRNTRRNRRVEIFSETKTYADWSKDPRCVVSRRSFERRIVAGWDATEALTLSFRKSGASA